MRHFYEYRHFKNKTSVAVLLGHVVMRGSIKRGNRRTDGQTDEVR